MKKLMLIFFCICLNISLYSQITPEQKAKNILESKDLDGDGALCRFECSDDLLVNFSKTDLNSDSFLSEEELKKYYTSAEAKTLIEK